jgi:hypothetical protein
MKLFQFGTDGGKDSGVTGFWFCEFKNFFSVALLHFKKGTRENYHSHAFNAYSFFLKGKVEEQHLNEDPIIWTPSLYPKYTPRSTFHRLNALEDTYCLTFRGAWSKTWFEYNPETKEYIELTNGREIVNTSSEPPENL